MTTPQSHDTTPQEPPTRNHRAVLEENLHLSGARVVDIGCGDGALVRLMTRAGARVIGIDPSSGQIARARAAEPAGDETYIRAGAQELPLPDGEFDIAVFFNALHHVPVDLQAAALGEAARVLRSGGLLYVVEPIAAGRYFELTRTIEDETHVRARAYAALQEAAQGPTFAPVREAVYLAPIRYDDFAQFRARLIAVDERRRPLVEAGEAALARAFEAAAERDEEGAYLFRQPFRLTLLRRG
ncbi:MAG: class I SAM-dependent methyltransferase [Alphaproteobacteria bacterium]|nr:MAG: class I SAM-dependent methyltransferase [Alphaproteobacteria bacterium]